MKNTLAKADYQTRQFSLRSLLLALTVMSICLGAISYVLQNEPRSKAEAKRRQAILQQRNAERERISQADLKDSQQLIADLEEIRSKLGRYPDDEEELISLRGKPMPMNGTRVGRVPVGYHKDIDGVHYGLTYRW